MTNELESYSTSELIGELCNQTDYLFLESSRDIYSKSCFNTIKEIVEMLGRRPEFK